MGCNVPLSEYSKFITDIEYIDFKISIAIVKNETDYESLCKAKSLDRYSRVYIGESESTHRDMTSFISASGLDLSDSMGLEVMDNIAGVAYHDISFGEMVLGKGLYYDQVGYLRASMSSLFYEKFKQYEYWGKKEDFDLAYSCVYGGSDDLRVYGEPGISEMRAAFKRDFIDRFVFGESLLRPSF